MKREPVVTYLTRYVQMRNAKMFGMFTSIFVVGEIMQGYKHHRELSDYTQFENALVSQMFADGTALDDVLACRDGLVSYSEEIQVRVTWLERLSYLVAIVVGLSILGLEGWTNGIRMTCFIGLFLACFYLLYAASRLNHLSVIYQGFIQVLDDAVKEMKAAAEAQAKTADTVTDTSAPLA